MRENQSAVSIDTTLLDDEEAVVAEVRILGCTLWTDFRFFAWDDLVRIKEDANLCVGSRHGAWPE